MCDKASPSHAQILHFHNPNCKLEMHRHPWHDLACSKPPKGRGLTQKEFIDVLACSKPPKGRGLTQKEFIDVLQVGDSSFEVRLRDSGGGVSARLPLLLTVTSVNLRPSFQIVDIVTVERWSPRQSAIFAYNVTAGEGEDDAQASSLTWHYSYNNPELFSDPPPELRVEVVDGMRVGVVYFSTDQSASGFSIFTKITLVDGGLENPMMGSYSKSYESSFMLYRVSNNQPPSFVPLLARIELLESPVLKVLSCTLNIRSSARMCRATHSVSSLVAVGCHKMQPGADIFLPSPFVAGIHIPEFCNSDIQRECGRGEPKAYILLVQCNSRIRLAQRTRSIISLANHRAPSSHSECKRSCL